MNYLVLVLSPDKQDFVSGPQPLFVCFWSYKTKHKFYSKICWHQWDSNSDRRTIRQVRWPPLRPKDFYDVQVVALLMFLALKRRVRNIGPMKKLFQNERHRDVYLMSFAKQNFAQIFGNFLGYLKYIGFFLKKLLFLANFRKYWATFYSNIWSHCLLTLSCS